MHSAMHFDASMTQGKLAHISLTRKAMCNPFCESSMDSKEVQNCNSSIRKICRWKGETLAKSPRVFIPRCPIQHDPPRKLTWQGKKAPFEDEFPIGNGDVQLSCPFSGGYIYIYIYEKILSPRVSMFLPCYQIILQIKNGSIQGPCSEVGDEHSTGWARKY